MKGAVRVSSVVWVKERQLGGRMGEVLVMKGTVQVSSTVWVGGDGRGGGRSWIVAQGK